MVLGGGAFDLSVNVEGALASRIFRERNGGAPVDSGFRAHVADAGPAARCVASLETAMGFTRCPSSADALPPVS